MGKEYSWKGKDFKFKSTRDTIYGLGFIGALIYFISTAHDFWGGLLGFLKAIVWPAFLVYGALKGLKL
jgi:hypothetical protein